MALIQCHECGTEVSTEAKTCPKCGAKPKKPAGLVSVLVVVLLGIAFVGAMSSGGGEGDAAHETPEQTAQKEASTKRYSAATGISSILRASMRDPDSLKFETLLVSDDASVVCAQYRARNGFGGMNREIFVSSEEGHSQEPDAWNKHCTKSMFDMLSAAK